MSLTRLARLAELARQHDPALGRWLAAGIDDWQHGEVAHLEQGLGLCGRGARQLRDAALRRAGELLVPDGSAWAQAMALARAIARGPRHGEIGEALDAAQASGCRVPTTARRLYDVLVRCRQGDGTDTVPIVPTETQA